MLSVHHITKSYGIHTVLNDITFNISRGERVGLIGPNGCGKTTLLRILLGQETPDRGSVNQTQAGLQVGYLAQGLELPPDYTLAQAIASVSGNAEQTESHLAELAAQLAQRPADRALQAAYDRALQTLQVSTANPQPILAALGLDAIPPDHRVGALSGGQKTRLGLALVLISEPSLLLLDEPTNHLDIGMLEWLEDWLASFSGAALIVSHDRTFLDRTVTSILELNAETHKIRQYDGSYSAYLEQKLAEQDRQWQEYSDWKDEIHQLRQAAAHVRGLARFRKGGKADSGDKFAKGFFANRGLETVRRAKHIEARLDRLLTEDRVEKPKSAWQMKLEFANPEHVSRDVLALENLAVGYPGFQPLLSDLNLVIRSGERVALIGPNGCGKTTLLRTIAGRLPPVQGVARLGTSVRLGYLSQEQEWIDPQHSALVHILRTAPFNETEARSFLHYFLFTGDDPLRPAGSLSFGERARLMLAVLVARGCNFLLLDEPINHLDIPSRSRFEQALALFEGTVLAVVHDRYFIERFASTLWQAQEGRVDVDYPAKVFEMEKG